jgi:hypothetical protein
MDTIRTVCVTQRGKELSRPLDIFSEILRGRVEIEKFYIPLDDDDCQKISNLWIRKEIDLLFTFLGPLFAETYRAIECVKIFCSSEIPISVIRARISEQQETILIREGADDCFLQPTYHYELALAHFEALLRRCNRG